MMIIETLGMRRLKESYKIYYRRCQAAVFVFDVSDAMSLQDIPELIDILSASDDSPLPKLLVGINKEHKDRVVPREQALKLAQD